MKLNNNMKAMLTYLKNALSNSSSNTKIYAFLGAFNQEIFITPIELLDFISNHNLPGEVYEIEYIGNAHDKDDVIKLTSYEGCEYLLTYDTPSSYLIYNGDTWNTYPGSLVNIYKLFKDLQVELKTDNDFYKLKK